MDTLDRSLEQGGRAMILGIVAYFDRMGEWPCSAEVNVLSGYKGAADKAATVAMLVDRGWLELHDHDTPNKRVKRFYVVTEAGRKGILPPDPLPELPPPWPPEALPEDEVERTIYAHALYFYRRKGRWPNGVERAHAFNNEASKMWSAARRRRAVLNLIADGRLVRVIFRNGKGDSTYLIDPRISPEYTNKNGWIFCNTRSSVIPSELGPSVEDES